MKQMKSGVYAFFNKMDKKVYVGSSKDIINRKEKHLNDLRKKRHHNAALQYDWSNGDDFDFKILEICEKKPAHILRTYECDYINKFLDEGYYLYNSNISCQGKYPYFMVRPKSFENSKGSVEEIIKLRDDLNIQQQKYNDLLLKNKELRVKCDKLENKLEEHSYLNHSDSFKMDLILSRFNWYGDSIIDYTNQLESTFFNDCKGMEGEIYRHYIDQFNNLSLFNRVFRCFYDLEVYHFDKNNFNKYGFLDRRIEFISERVEDIKKSCNVLKNKISNLKGV